MSQNPTREPGRSKICNTLKKISPVIAELKKWQPS